MNEYGRSERVSVCVCRFKIAGFFLYISYGDILLVSLKLCLFCFGFDLMYYFHVCAIFHAIAAGCLCCCCRRCCWCFCYYFTCCYTQLWRKKSSISIVTYKKKQLFCFNLFMFLFSSLTTNRIINQRTNVSFNEETKKKKKMKQNIQTNLAIVFYLCTHMWLENSKTQFGYCICYFFFHFFCFVICVCVCGICTIFAE